MKPLLAALLAVAPAASVAPLAAQAPATTGPVTYGAGHKLCSEWSAAEVKPDETEYRTNRFWVAGFMSAYNVYVSPAGYDIGKGLTPDDMKAFMHTRCAAHPDETIAAAATAFLAMLRARPAH
jgi:hypothetical protein